MHCTRLHKGPAHMYELRAKKPLSLRKVNCKTLDVVVSFDGTWGKEGLTSLEEVFLAIKVHSRCTLCCQKLGKNVPSNSHSVNPSINDFRKWRAEQLASGECDKFSWYLTNNESWRTSCLLGRVDQQLDCTSATNSYVSWSCPVTSISITSQHYKSAHIPLCAS